MAWNSTSIILITSKSYKVTSNYQTKYAKKDVKGKSLWEKYSDGN